MLTLEGAIGERQAFGDARSQEPAIVRPIFTRSFVLRSALSNQSLAVIMNSDAQPNA
jgi:hypothetical protein